MDVFSSVLEAAARVIGQIDGPVGLISLIVILFSFVTLVFFRNEGPWFRVFGILLMFSGSAGLAYALLSNETAEIVSVRDKSPEDYDHTEENEAEPYIETKASEEKEFDPEKVTEKEAEDTSRRSEPSKNVEVENSKDASEEHVEAADDRPAISGMPKGLKVFISEPEKNLGCAEGVYKEFGYACVNYNPPHWASVTLVFSDGVTFQVYASGPLWYANSSNKSTHESYEDGQLVLEAIPRALSVGTTIFGSNSETVPAPDHTVEITFPGCDGGVNAHLGKIEFHEASKLSFARSRVDLLQNDPTVYEEFILQCGTEGRVDVKYLTQSNAWRQFSFDRKDFFLAVRELKNIYRRF